MIRFFRKVYKLYSDGFRDMTVGRTLWLIIVIKIVILFFVVKLIFFPDKLGDNYDTDAERSQAVRSALTAK